MIEDIIDLPISEKIKDFMRKPLIKCVTPNRKGENILKAEEENTDSEPETDGWDWGADTNVNTGWNRKENGSGCSPCCSPCSPCIPNTNREQCGPDDDRCYPNCSPCNPCYPCMPVEEHDRDRG